MSNFRSEAGTAPVNRGRKIRIDQLLRASSSVALNLSEGNDRFSLKDRRKFVNIALTSLRETQTICKLEELKELEKKADQLAAMIYVLNRNLTEAIAGADK